MLAYLCILSLSLQCCSPSHLSMPGIVWIRGKCSIGRLLSIRGGKEDNKASVLSEEDDLSGDDLDEGDYKDAPIDAQASGHGVLTDLWNKTPPITQTYIASSVFVTAVSWAVNKNYWPNFLNFDWKGILLGFQVWRLFTPFLFLGPLGLNYVLTIHFVWMYMAQLEKLNHNHPEEFCVLLMFGAATLIVGYTMLGLSTRFLGHNLSAYLLYIWARIFEGADVNVMDLFVLKAELLPWFFCAQTFLLEGELPIADFLGIVVGHLYHYLTQQKILFAPQFLQDAFDSPLMKEKYAKFKGDFE